MQFMLGKIKVEVNLSSLHTDATVLSLRLPIGTDTLRLDITVRADDAPKLIVDAKIYGAGKDA